MQDVLDHLPSRPASVEQVFDLMKTPRKVGFVSPLFGVASGFVGVYFEHRGKMKAAGYTGSEWVAMGSAHEDLDEFFHGKESICGGFIEEVADDLREVRGSDFSTAHPEVQYEAPFGYQVKLCIPHHELSVEEFIQFEHYPQFMGGDYIWGSRSNGIVGVLAVERALDPTQESGAVFAYFNPDLSTWRIVDVIDVDAPSDVGDQIHAETRNKAQEYYDDLEMLVGPEENIIQ